MSSGAFLPAIILSTCIRVPAPLLVYFAFPAHLPLPAIPSRKHLHLLLTVKASFAFDMNSCADPNLNAGAIVRGLPVAGSIGICGKSSQSWHSICIIQATSRAEFQFAGGHLRNLEFRSRVFRVNPISFLSHTVTHEPLVPNACSSAVDAI